MFPSLGLPVAVDLCQREQHLGGALAGYLEPTHGALHSQWLYGDQLSALLLVEQVADVESFVGFELSVSVEDLAPWFFGEEKDKFVNRALGD
ncbi:hypothetical protein F0562_019468 [Nyssa sinensis]|uniref:Uncharacterized protein n=1 Tax=Nyssa sinensis TaxID=561372 RepID=A0A5J5BNQ1_9ASTE|nr:hypothetical protein F0562_019468 [Nyssa sinensis]